MEDFSLYMGVYGVAEPTVTPVEIRVNLILRFYLKPPFQALFHAQPEGFHCAFKLFKPGGGVKAGNEVMYMPDTLLIKQTKKTKKAIRVFEK